MPNLGETQFRRFVFIALPPNELARSMTPNPASRAGPERVITLPPLHPVRPKPRPRPRGSGSLILLRGELDLRTVT